MIRIKAMPTVAPRFLQGMIYVAQERLKYFMEYPYTSRDRNDKKAIGRATTIKYLLPVARGERPALDLMLSRLRKLDYSYFAFDSCGSTSIGEGKFVCKTNPLIMTDNSGRRRIGSPDRWEIGEYLVEAPVFGILNAALETFKMRPFRADVIEDGTYSHGAYHPHHTRNSTCWSEWMYPITEGCRNCNFDMLFGAFIGFLKSYNSNSPLSTPPWSDPGDRTDISLYWMKPVYSGD